MSFDEFELVPMFGNHVVRKKIGGELVGNIIPFGDDFAAHKLGTRSSGGRPIGVGVYPSIEIA